MARSNGHLFRNDSRPPAGIHGEGAGCVHGDPYVPLGAFVGVAEGAMVRDFSRSSLVSVLSIELVWLISFLGSSAPLHDF